MQREPSTIVAEADIAARDARAVLEHPGLKRAFAAAEGAYLARIRKSDPATGHDERESAFLLLRALDALREDLAATAAGGAIARRNLRSSLIPTNRS